MNRSRFIGGLFAGVSMVLLLWGGAASGQTGSAAATGAADRAFDVLAYVVKGYSATGPIGVHSVDTSKQILTLYSQPKNITIKQQGRSVSVTNASKARLTLKDLEKGTSVYVLQKAKEVLIVALSKKQVRNDQ